MTTPDDKTLLEFVARFAGWDEFADLRGLLHASPRKGWNLVPVPDYLTSVDAWFRDVWPKVLGLKDEGLPGDWNWKVHEQLPEFHRQVSDLMNATARQRCLALWLALDGKLPESINTTAETAEKTPQSD